MVAGIDFQLALLMLFGSNFWIWR